MDYKLFISYDWFLPYGCKKRSSKKMFLSSREAKLAKEQACFHIVAAPHLPFRTQPTRAVQRRNPLTDHIGNKMCTHKTYSLHIFQDVISTSLSKANIHCSPAVCCSSVAPLFYKPDTILASYTKSA